VNAVSAGSRTIFRKRHTFTPVIHMIGTNTKQNISSNARQRLPTSRAYCFSRKNTAGQPCIITPSTMCPAAMWLTL